MDDGDFFYGKTFLGLPHGTTPAAVITNKSINISSFESSDKRQRVGHIKRHFAHNLCIYTFMNLRKFELIS